MRLASEPREDRIHFGVKRAARLDDVAAGSRRRGEAIAVYVRAKRDNADRRNERL